MMQSDSRKLLGQAGRYSLMVLATAALAVWAKPARATTLRIGAYNIDADTSDFETDGVPREPYLKNVLSELGSATLAGHAQPLDVLAVEEPYGDPTVTLQAMVNDLNALYPGANYQFDHYVYSGPNLFSTGNGPNALIYNANTVQDITLNSGNNALNVPKPIGTTGPDRAAREPLRYTLQAVGYGAPSQFYMYVEHAKAKAGTDDGAAFSNAYRRTSESVAVRQDADSLPAGSHIIFAGDYNTVDGSLEQSYKNMVAATGSTLKNGDGSSAGLAGTGQAYDPVNPTNDFITNSSTYKTLYSYSDTNLTRRYDYEFISNSVNPATGTPGLQLVPGSYTIFGNSSAPFSGATSDQNLVNLTDHLPVVADYQIVGLPLLPEPGVAGVGLAVGVMAMRRRRA